jgi:Fe-S cluster biosynthesis and repair protein YggX
MANDSCGPTPPANEPVKPGTRMVHCVKFDRDLPGLDRPPWKGELLNPLDPNSQKIMEEQMEQFFFGEGAKLPEGYVAPKAKG